MMWFLKLSRLRQLLSGVGIILIAVALFQLAQTTAGLRIQRGQYAVTPFKVMSPEIGVHEKRPLVLVAHGLAGSGRIMDGLALTFAHAGYAVASWGFDGHGNNPYPMETDIYAPWLVENVEQVLEAIHAFPDIDTTRMAILGHSMGTAAALRFAQIYPHIQATVAISPVKTPVTPELPRNLLLLAGQLEPDFVGHARDRLAEAGGPGGHVSAGTARDLQIIPGVEHISILFAPRTHQVALDWLDQTFGPQPQARKYIDRRLLWYALVVLGTLLLAGSLIPRSPAPELSCEVSPKQAILIMLTSSVGATLFLWVLGLMGVPLNTLFGIRAGGYLILWFLVSGSMGLAMMKPWKALPVKDEVINSLLIFATLWLGIGLVGGVVWLPWLLIFKRLILWPLVVLALLPWSWLAGILGAGSGAGRRWFWWLLQSIILFGALLLAIKMSPSLGFLMLLLPVFPLVLLFLVIPNLYQRGNWTFALSGALFISWMLLAVFPLI